MRPTCRGMLQFATMHPKNRKVKYFLILGIIVMLFLYRASRGSGEKLPTKGPFPPIDPIVRKDDQGVPLVRAILTHHPFRTSWQQKYLDQLKMFHRSWKEMIKTQKPEWRTDFVIIVEKTIPLFKHLNCSTTLRANRTQSTFFLSANFLTFSFFLLCHCGLQTD